MDVFDRGRLYYYNLGSGKLEEVGSGDYAVEWPRFSPNGKVNIYVYSILSFP